MEKYRLTDETIVADRHTLHHIEALRDILMYAVEVGDLGGFIESTNNLNQNSDCWIADKARVYDDAWVCGNAHVYGNARVHGHTWIYGDTWVCGNAQVSDNVWM